MDSGPKDAIIPVSVKQLRSHFQSGGIYNLDKPKFCLLGVVREEKQDPTQVLFELDDSSGIIPVVWFSEGFVFEGFSVGCYVKLFGEYSRDDAGPDKFQAFHVRPLTTFNEVTHHLLRCVHAHKKTHRAKWDVADRSKQS